MAQETMYAQTDIHCDGEVYVWGQEVSEEDVGDGYDALVESGALADTHPAISNNPGAVEALRHQGEQLNLVKERLAAALAKIEELTGEPVDEFELTADTTTAGNTNVSFDNPATVAGDPDYDPADHSVEEVIAYLGDKDETFRNNILEKEEAGKNRSTLLNHFER